MGIHNLDKIFRPHRIAVVGASDREGSVGATVQRNLLTAGFTGVVYPVNPNREAVQGIQAYPDVAALPRPADLAIICTPADTVPTIVNQCGEAGIRGLIILSAGFRELGDAGQQLEQHVGKAARRLTACGSWDRIRSA
jgi:acetyltransferase